MFSYIFMKILEARPRSYDRRMNQLSLGRVGELKGAAAAETPDRARVLEVGCGTGELAVTLLERATSVDGFDRSPAMVETARERIAAAGLADRVKVWEMGVEGMDGLGDGAYDAVVSTFVLSELADDERRFALVQARRVLVPGGRLVIVAEVVPRSPGEKLLQTLARAPAAAATFLVSRSTTRPIADLTGDVDRAGFVVEREERSHGGTVMLLVATRPG